MVERLEDLDASLLSDSQLSGAAEPSEGAFDHPAMPSQAFRTVDATPRDARLDSTPTQCRAATREVVALVGMELGRSPLRSANAVADRRHGIDHLFEEAAVVDVGRGQPESERDALGISDQVALGACSAAIGRATTASRAASSRKPSARSASSDR